MRVDLALAALLLAATSAAALPLTKYEVLNARFMDEMADKPLQVHLRNGRQTIRTPDGHSSYELRQVAFGDLDGDKQEDAAAILVQHGGGTGRFYSLQVLRNEKGKPSYFASHPLGDRIRVLCLSIEKTEAGKPYIQLVAVVHADEDPACCPTRRQVFSVFLRGRGLEFLP